LNEQFEGLGAEEGVVVGVEAGGKGGKLRDVIPIILWF
jgi:hypothetical protein